MVREPAPPVYAKPTPPVISTQYAQPAPAPAPQAAPPPAVPQQVFKDPFNAVVPSVPAVSPPKVAKEAATTMPSSGTVPRAAPSQPGGGNRVDVELGIHSASNFYKGLGGNDVIEHGGIFVTTYKVLKINTPVTLRILLPGDYEFTASAVVQWTREAGSSEPGYGARFTQISAEGRQLVYRYTRNREPMFYDDL
jgi:Tfp pilus assembly protein PilZ